jgi:ribonuclease BN (tRNA processing enzyme)
VLKLPAMNPATRWVRLVIALLLSYCDFGSNLRAQTTAPRLEVLVLGSGGPGAAGRAGSCYLVFLDGVARILVDAGPGSFVRLGEAKASLSDTDMVLLTHLHIDHTGELPGLFKSRAVSSSSPIVFDVWGPKGSPGGHHQGAYFPATSEFVQLLFGPKGAFAYLSDFSAPMTIREHDLSAAVSNASPHQIFKQADLEITAIAGHHGDAPAVIYRIDHAGRSVTFSGDIDAQGLPALRNIAKGADLLVFNTVVLDPPGSPSILYTLHTPPHAIGQLARDAGVQALLLSHLSPAIDEKRDAVTASIHQSYTGSIVFAKDGLRVRP